MSSRNSTLSPSSAATGNRPERTAAGGAAGVEIVGFPQILYTRTFGDPDTLFVPLLDAAREAFAMSERLSSHGENKANAVMLSGMQLASSLLRDSSFSLMAKGATHENMYTVDLTEGTLHVLTRLYAVVSRRTSFFKLEIAGKLVDGPFVARNPVNGEVVMQIEEQQLRHPNFFSGSLAQDCLRAQIESERFGHSDKGPEAPGELRLTITASGNKIPVVLRQKEAGGTWDIVDGRRQEWVGTLAPDMEKHVKAVTAFIQELFAHK
jgi:hypothetical protein